jgi:hypothetical protein
MDSNLLAALSSVIAPEQISTNAGDVQPHAKDTELSPIC